MPRSQLPSPAWYHVISRGVEQRTIVLDDRDRESWFKLLVDITKRFGWRVHAWNLLDNHFHLLVETTQPQLSRGMQRLNGVHAIRFNRRYARSGHLFQGRFETRVLEGDEHLATVIEYVYENSTRVGLRGWPWRGSGDHPRDYASARARREVETEPAADRGDRAPERRRGDPSRRGARPLQRTGGALEPARALRGAAGALVVDLAEVDFVDSTALGVLIEARTKLENRRSFLLAAPGLETHRALTISGLDQHLSVHETVEQALAANLN
jgi:anti-anti-sigma factor